MADFEGIALAGEGPACGCVLMLRAGSAISRVVNLPQGVEVEVRREVPAVVVRGMSAADHESVLFQGPELANRALDILAGLCLPQPVRGTEHHYLHHQATAVPGMRQFRSPAQSAGRQAGHPSLSIVARINSRPQANTYFRSRDSRGR